MSDDESLYRLVLAADIPEDAWRTRLQWTTAFVGVTGLDDQFIHLSTAEQVAHTAEAHFAGRSDVMLLCFSTSSMCDEADLDIRWEDGYPHVYGGPIPFACLSAAPTLLQVGSDGKHAFPAMGSVAATATSGHRLEDEEDHYISSDDDYDGCGATGMYG